VAVIDMIQQLACMQIAVSISSAGTVNEQYTYQWKLQRISSVDNDKDHVQFYIHVSDASVSKDDRG